ADRVLHGLIGNGFKLDIATVGKPRIDGKEVVHAVDLDPVAGEVDEGPVGLVGFVAERLERLRHAVAVEVRVLHGLKPGLPERVSHNLGVTPRVGQGGDQAGCVAGITDHQSNAAFLSRSRRTRLSSRSGSCLRKRRNLGSYRRLRQRGRFLRALAIYTDG